MVKPISPNEVKHVIPDLIIEAVNKLIQEKWDGKRAVIKQCEILDRIVNTNQDSPNYLTRGEIFEKHFLDFENLYRAEGWNVDYDKPAYCETYEPYFTFTKEGK